MESHQQSTERKIRTRDINLIMRSSRNGFHYREHFGCYYFSQTTHNTTNSIHECSVLTRLCCNLPNGRKSNCDTKGMAGATRSLFRRATRSPILSIQNNKSTRNNSLKPEPWRKPEGCNYSKRKMRSVYVIANELINLLLSLFSFYI